MLLLAAVLGLSGCPKPMVLLTWDAEPSAASFNVYRDGTKVGTSLTNSYTDYAPVVGTDSYVVTAIGVNGLESGVSNLAEVVVK